MKHNISNLHLIQNAVGRWVPSDLGFITEFSYHKNSEIKKWCFKISGLFQRRDLHTSWPCMNEEFFEVKMCFYNIKNLNIKEINSNPIQVTGFDIIDISDRGWEDMSFLIEDYEDGKLEFYCSEIEIISVGNSLPWPNEFK